MTCINLIRSEEWSREHFGDPASACQAVNWSGISKGASSAWRATVLPGGVDEQLGEEPNIPANPTPGKAENVSAVLSDP